MLLASTSAAPMLAPLPFAIGRSPFRTKGLLYRGVIQQLKAMVPGGLDAIAEAAGDDELGEFIRQPFLASSFYDVLPAVWLADTAAALVGQRSEAFMKQRAAEQAITDLNGVHRVMLAAAPPAVVAMRMARLTLRYFDFGGADPTREGPCHVRIRRSGVPNVLVRWHDAVSSGYVEALLLQAGAKAPSCQVAHVECEGTVHGVPTYTLTFDITWRE